MNSGEQRLCTEQLTGQPSVDKPWLKFYSKEAVETKLPECTMYEYLYENNKEHLSDYALNYFGNRITYGELFENIDIIARAFLKYGIKPNDVVTILTVGSVQGIMILYALNKIGAISNFVNVMADKKDLIEYFKDARSKVVISLNLFAEAAIKASEQTGVESIIVYSLEEWMPMVARCGYRAKYGKMEKDWQTEKNIIPWQTFIKSAGTDSGIQYRKNPNTVCFYGHTGGTTGFPKTVLLNDNAFNSVVWQYAQSFPHQRTEVFLNVMIPFVVYGIVTNIHMPLCLGLEVVVIPKFEPDKWHRYCKKYRPNYISAIPAYIQAMGDDNNLAKMDLSHIKMIGMGGEGMNIFLEKKMNDFLKIRGSKARITKGYGMTEVCATTTCETYNAMREGSVGIPFINSNVMIYDNDKEQELPYNTTGEICIQSASMMLGYKDNKAEMDTLLRKHPDGNRWIHTGDLGYMDEDGFLFVEGRMKRIIMIVRDGLVYKMFPAQTEEVLNTHPMVRESCVVSMTVGNEIALKAVIILETANALKQEICQELNKICEQSLATYQIPREYVFVEEFPRTAAGKVDYRQLETE